MRRLFIFSVLLLCTTQSYALDATKLYYTLRDKVLSVKDYSADVKMKIDVNFMKIPQLNGRLLFKSPDKMRLERNGGISFLPKKNINLTLSNLIPIGNVTVIDLGEEQMNGQKVRVVKVIPEDDISNIVLSKVWINETDLVAVRAETTTRNEGTVIMELKFGNYTKYALPDRMTIHMDLKDFKMPKGVTMDYDDATAAPKPPKEMDGKHKKGTIQINYLHYEINKGIADERFSKG